MKAKSTSSSASRTSFSMDDFAKALEEYDYQFERGQTVRGKVFEYTSEGVYVDIGGKSSGFVPLREASLSEGGNIAEILPLQSDFEFLIIKGQDEDGQVTLSRRQLQINSAWENVAASAESGKSVQMRVTGVNKGGVMGELDGLRAFIPRSHLSQQDDLESLVGQLLTATFLEVDRDRNKLVLSQRKAMRAAAMTQIQQGVVREGKVVSIKPYGVFVDLNGISGLLHITQVTGVQVESLTTVFKIGDIIKVAILEVDEHTNRISLSTKVLESYPGEILDKFAEVMANAEERWDNSQQKLSE